ncbi:hypothetical protein JVU11DRAFT_5727 [Chiua virens]|nr:hypothetical protein JVU11DRAFT_5727 [Chiua virens]
MHVDHRYHHSPAFGSPGPSRRPLPTPRSRPESMPPPPRQSPLVVQAPAPSRPVILSQSAVFPISPTAPPARRPLPTPVLSPPKPATKHSSLDLTARPTSPVKSAINTDTDPDLRIPSSFSRRTAPLLDVNHHLPPTLPNPHPDTHETQSAPLWNRNLPSAPAPTVIERRSTVSGVFPPAALQPRSNPPRTQSPQHPPAQRLQSSPTRRPLPSSPTEPPRIPHYHECDDHDISSPNEFSLPHPYTYEPITFADPQAEEDDDDDDEIVLSTDTNASSPKYGIRDLPARAWIAIANRDNQTPVVTSPSTQHEQTTRQRPVRSVTLPQPPASESQPSTPGLPQSPRAPVSPPASGRSPAPTSPALEHQSLTLRFAAMGLAEERTREREKQAMSSPSPAQSPTRAAPGPTSPVRQQHGWPTNVPPLPRTPGSTTRPVFGTVDVTMKTQSFKPNGALSSSPSLPTSPTHSARPLSSSPGPLATFDRKSVAQQHQHQPQSQQIPQLTARQLEKQRVRDADIDLDDAPPPSLRRSPSPIRQGFTRPPAIEITNDTPPRRQWTPGQDVTSRIGNASVNGTGGPHPGFRAASRSPERRGQPLPQPQAKPQFNSGG